MPSMDAPPFPIPSGRRLVVTGSLSAKAQDRTLDRDSIRSVQVIGVDGAVPAPWFDARGDLGVSSFVFPAASDRVLFSTGADLVEVSPGAPGAVEIPVPDLVDVHEMTIVDDTLWLANTGRDEGGIVTASDGGPLDLANPHFLAASNRALHDELLEVLAKSSAAPESY